MTVLFKQKMTLLVGGLLIVIIVAISSFFYVDKFTSVPVTVEDIDIDTKAALKLNVLEQISKKNGIKEWELKAASATLYKKKKRALLKDVQITFFTKDNKRVKLTSRTGTLNTRTHDMTFSEKVVVTYESSMLETDKLHYKKKTHIIHTDTRVKLTKDRSVVEADSMTTRLNDNLTILEGNVKGRFSEKFKLL